MGLWLDGHRSDPPDERPRRGRAAEPWALRGDLLPYRLGLLADLTAASHSDAIDVVVLNDAPPALARTYCGTASS